ncbi:MAG: hypothetical protein KF864_10400 [Phycisphaeraceae bacterium]|nr:hypothetical protein [Phycisphaeraceae bacterium]
MKSWGIFLIIMAVGSAVLPHLGMPFIILSWIENWGETAAWIIRGALLAIGVGLVIKSTRHNAPTPPG